MENNNKFDQESKNAEKSNDQKTKDQKPKIVNLFEDMNTHEHDDNSFQQMINEQKSFK